VGILITVLAIVFFLIVVLAILAVFWEKREDRKPE
jgi:hypothetical protein